MATRTISKVNIREVQPLTLISEKLLDQTWIQWKKEIMGFFELCELLPIVDGTLPIPDAAVQPDDAKAWLFNNRFAKVLIRKSVGSNQFINITHRDTSNSMWKSLISVHEERGHQTATAIHCALTQTYAEEEVL